MRILNGEEIRQAEGEALTRPEVSSLVFIQRAGYAVAQFCMAHFKFRRVCVVCGAGKNGATPAELKRRAAAIEAKLFPLVRAIYDAVQRALTYLRDFPPAGILFAVLGAGAGIANLIPGGGKVAAVFELLNPTAMTTCIARWSFNNAGDPTGGKNIGAIGKTVKTLGKEGKSLYDGGPDADSIVAGAADGAPAMGAGPPHAATATASATMAPAAARRWKFLTSLFLLERPVEPDSKSRLPQPGRRHPNTLGTDPNTDRYRGEASAAGSRRTPRAPDTP